MGLPSHPWYKSVVDGLIHKANKKQIEEMKMSLAVQGWGKARQFLYKFKMKRISVKTMVDDLQAQERAARASNRRMVGGSHPFAAPRIRKIAPKKILA